MQHRLSARTLDSTPCVSIERFSSDASEGASLGAWSSRVRDDFDLEKAFDVEPKQKKLCLGKSKPEEEIDSEPPPEMDELDFD